MGDILQGALRWDVTRAVNVSAVKSARLQARVVGGSDADAAACVLTMQASTDGENWIDTATTLGSITLQGVHTSIIDVDGTNWVRARVTTVAGADALIDTSFGTQVEV